MNRTILLLLTAFVTVGSFGSGTGHAQVRDNGWAVEPVPPLATSDAGAVALRRGGHAFLRTLATLGASAGGFALAQSYHEGAPDELVVPIAAGAAAAAVAAIPFSRAHPIQVIAGSALSTLPAGALATYLAGMMDDGEQKQIPLIAFSIPHGLLSSAFAKD